MIRLACLLFGLFGTTATAISFAACSDDRGGFDDKREVLGDPDAEPPPAPPGCGFRCSRDLKTVLMECNGVETLVTTCPPEQGCGVDHCVDACESAALSKGSIGCSFWTLPPDDPDPDRGAGGCFAAMIANTWDRAANISADWGAEPLDISESIYTAKMVGESPTYTRLTGSLPPGEVAIVFLSEASLATNPRSIRCPEGVKAAVNVDPIGHGTTKTKAFNLKTDVPVSAYSSFPYGGAKSQFPTSTLLLPVTSWDSKYIAVSTGMFGDAQTLNTQQRTLQVVSSEDNTTVSMRPNITIYGGKDVLPAGAGEVQTWTLSRGQVLQITQRGNASGSPIQSNKPVAVFGGAPCSYLPAGIEYCDLTQQQIPPFAQWGSEYALVPFPPRSESITGTLPEMVPWTFVGAADGTTLTYEPRRPPGAPEVLSVGQAVHFMTDQLVTVKSQDSKHAFYAGVHMSGAAFGGGAPGGNLTKGDPDFVNVVPSDQFLDRYVFFADYTYPDTMLSVVRRKTATGFLSVELECGEITGFAPLGSSGEYEYGWIRLTRDSTPQNLGKGTCGYGRHEARSDGPFSITVWGTGQFASYGYAGGMGSRPINDTPLPPVN